MSFSLTINDQLTPDLARLLTALRPAGSLNAILGRTAVNTFRKQFFALDRTHRNKIGGDPTHFWSQCARSTSYQPLSNGAGLKIVVSQVGARQRVEGGQINPIKSKWLTIPARSESYGRRAREFDNLRFVQFRPDLAALIAGAGEKGGGATVTRTVKRGSQTVTKVGHVKNTWQGLVMYWLVKTVTQPGDPSILPPADTIRSDLTEAARAHLTRLTRRQTA